MTFRIPPLRERKEDIPLLINHFLDGCGRQVTSSLMRLLVAYDWPGNIRELENELKKMVLLAGDAREIGPEVVSRKIVAGASKAAVPIETVRTGLPTPDVEFSDDYSLYDFLAAHERQFILRALKSKKGIKKHAAAALNIPESTLRLKIKQYNIDLGALSA